MRIDGPSINVSSVAATLHKQFIGSRWLEARESSANEFAFYSRAAEAAKRRAGHAAAYRRPPQADAVRAPADERDVLVICHGTPMDVVDGRIELNNLLDGRVDVLSRCATAALFVSHGMRRQTRLWLHLADRRLTLCCDGTLAKGLNPDERSMASAIKRSLSEHQRQCGAYGPAAASALVDSGGRMPPGWSVHSDEGLKDRLHALGVNRPCSREAEHEQRRPVTLVVLDENGKPLTPQVLTDAAPEAQAAAAVPTDASDQDAASPPRVLLVLGDHRGFSSHEDGLLRELGGVRARVSRVPLLASHSIVLAHAVLDEVALG